MILLDYLIDYTLFGAGYLVVKALRIKRYQSLKWDPLLLENRNYELVVVGVVFWVVLIAVLAIII